MGTVVRACPRFIYHGVGVPNHRSHLERRARADRYADANTHGSPHVYVAAAANGHAGANRYAGSAHDYSRPYPATHSTTANPEAGTTTATRCGTSTN